MLNKLFFLYLRDVGIFFDWVFFEWRRYRITKNAIVADFGSGDRPFLRANILVDRAPEGTTERPDEFLDNGAYIVYCDLALLPFRNKSLDFVYSSHTIEHLENMRSSLEEINRTARRGFLTCPSKKREIVFSVRSHLWLVELASGKLVFTRKNKPFSDEFGDFFGKTRKEGKGYFLNLIDDCFRNEFIINYLWKDRIKYEIHNEKNNNKWEKDEDYGIIPGKRPLWMSIRRKLLMIFSFFVRNFFSKKINILSVLCCPVCKKELSVNKKHLVCQDCNRKFEHSNLRIFNFNSH